MDMDDSRFFKNFHSPFVSISNNVIKFTSGKLECMARGLGLGQYPASRQVQKKDRQARDHDY